MSGTSMDGIDVALIDTDGSESLERRAFRSYAYGPGQYARLLQAKEEAKALRQRGDRPGSLAEVEAELTRWHAAAVRSFLEETALGDSPIDLIGFHGQTVIHRPHGRLTVQLGDGAALAHELGIEVVNDFRAADVAAGGEGAPFVPAYHRALAGAVAARPVAFVNIGGVANITWVGREGELLAFDTGPGNALLNDWVNRHTGEPIDRGGRLAAQGRIHQPILAELLEHRFFDLKPPKSLDRDSFAGDLVGSLPPEDGAATLTAFTAKAIARSIEHLPEAPQSWIICGGGRHNPSLMGMLEEELSGLVAPAEALKLDGDAIEAEAFAYLAVRSLRGLPLSFPTTTGVAEPMTGGVLHHP